MHLRGCQHGSLKGLAGVIQRARGGLLGSLETFVAWGQAGLSSRRAQTGAVMWAEGDVCWSKWRGLLGDLCAKNMQPGFTGDKT